MKILVFDNYDSFTYNLVHLVEKIIRDRVDVVRNDQIPLEAVDKYDKIILSPGPGVPAEAGLLLPLIKQYASTKSHTRCMFGPSGDRRGFWRKVGESFKSVSRSCESGTYYSERKAIERSKCESFQWNERWVYGRTISQLGNRSGWIS